MDSSRKRLAKIRCLRDCIALYRNHKPLPHQLCYVPETVEYSLQEKFQVRLYNQPDDDLKYLNTRLTCSKRGKLTARGEELVNAKGQWVQVLKVETSKVLWEASSEGEPTPAWFLLQPFRSNQPSSNSVSAGDIPTPIGRSSMNWMDILETLLTLGPTRYRLTPASPYVHSLAQRQSTITSPRQPASISQSSSTEQSSESTADLSASVIAGQSPSTTRSFPVAQPPLADTKQTASSSRTGSPIPAVDEEAVNRLLAIPPNWTLAHDRDLSNFLLENLDIEKASLGTVRNYVEAISVSSNAESSSEDFLIDGDTDTFWESDGQHGQHWIRLKMKKETIIKSLMVVVDMSSDDNYVPDHLVVMGGPLDRLDFLRDIRTPSGGGHVDIPMLDNVTRHLPYIEIRIKSCKDDGIDTRIHGLKIKASKEVNLGLHLDIFTAEKMLRYPKLENYPKEVLYSRSLCLQRLVMLLDSVLSFLVPDWSYSSWSLNLLVGIKHLLPLSQKRMSLVEYFLKETQTEHPDEIYKLHINRRLAADHRANPTLDPEGSHSVFHQIYDGLLPRERARTPLDYKWSSSIEQWWQCKFVSEGIIDQGGGFRDSLCDMAEELCPLASDVPVPLPYFLRSPNQVNGDNDSVSDMYTPNPACTKFHRYQWIGQLMGGCFRGKESLVLLLAPFFWKKLTGEPVTWATDYCTIDAADVRITETMQSCDEEAFSLLFDGQMWSYVDCSGRVVPVKSNGDAIPLEFWDRNEYIKLAMDHKMSQFDQQISAIREGFLSVIPVAVISLLTLTEVEQRVCGDPDIPVEALRRSVCYEDLDGSETRVKYLWQVLEKFTNEDRSKFLRFVTGRRRLPCPLYVCPGKSDVEDLLPESSTCSNTLYLPCFSSPKIAEEKIRYAAYNCVAIDTDVNTWEE